MKKDYIKYLKISSYRVYKKYFSNIEKELLDNLVFIRKTKFTEKDYEYLKWIKNKKEIENIEDYAEAKNNLEKELKLDLNMAYQLIFLDLKKEDKNSFIKLKIK